MIDPISALTSAVTSKSPVSEARFEAVQKAAPLGAVGTSADFGNILAQVSADAVQNLRTGEAAAISGIQGKASVQQVVQAVMSAEQTLHTAIAVRDKVVAAYQELSRMAI